MRHPGHAPRTDAAWALNTHERVRALEQSTSTRVGSMVLNEVDGRLLVSKPGQESFEIKPVEEVSDDASTGGGSARMHRASTAAVLLAGGGGATQLLPADTFDLLTYGANGIGVDLSIGSLKVTRGGIYTVVFRAQADNVFKSNNAIGGGHTVTPLLYVNGAVHEYGSPSSSAVDGLLNTLGSTALASRWTVRLSAGDIVTVGYRNDHAMDTSGDYHRLVGDASGAGTFLLITPE